MGGKALRAVNEAGEGDGAPGGAEVGAGRMAAWTGVPERCLRAKGLGRPRSYLNGRVEESWTADGVGYR